MRRLVRVAALAAAMSVVPTSALAVYVSSYHGEGTQTRSTSYGNGAAVGGDLRSKQGYPVYYEGRINLSGFGCSSTKEVGRYSNNTSTTYYVSRGGTITGLLGSCSATSVSSRISRDISGAPDPSGYWSAGY